MSSNDLAGIDAFDNIVERLVAAMLDRERARERVDAANSEVAQLKADVANVKRQLAAYERQGAQNGKVHQVLKDALQFICTAEGGSAHEDLVARLSQAIRDTDEIPF